MDGFVVVSLNLGVVRTEEDRIVMIFSPRSSVASLQEDTKERLNTLAETFGFTVSHSSEYPGWSFKEDSPVREICKESYKELFGEDLKRSKDWMRSRSDRRSPTVILRMNI